MAIQVRLDLSDNDIKLLAFESRWLREDPTKRWSKREYEEHARHAVGRIIREFIRSKAGKS